MKNAQALAVLSVVFAAGTAAARQSDFARVNRQAAPNGPRPAGDFVLASTTSLRDTGLLDVLVKRFAESSGIKVKAIAVGTGQALALARAGEADAVVAHSKADEEKLIADGYGIDPVTLMYNRFIVVGPKTDPANVKGAGTAAGAFARIAGAGSPFVSRGDKSGTHVCELAMWAAAGVKPDGEKWYVKSGSGMGQTLMIAKEKAAYTLADSATWGAFATGSNLAVVFDRGDELKNVYRYIRTNEAKLPKVNAGAARCFAQFLCAKETMELIRSYGADKPGGPLFVPMGCPENRR
ncbi:MAG: substrate-binding domain-containing protein [Deltaproteobacteria bacterium]|nr:substrate-binding domain-containing protein [Deltaproteobacteria bacterium]